MSGPVGASPWMYGIVPPFYDYKIDQSLRFNDPDNPYLYRTPSSQGSLTTFTYSFWYKRSLFGAYQEVFHQYPGSGERSQILFMNNDTLKVELEAANVNHFLTNMLFRDSSAWYHVVVTFDSTNAVSTNRVKIYVNGVDQADTANGGGGFSTATYPSQNATSGFNTTTQHEISTYDGTDYHLDGYLAEVNFVDGTALTASSFGETKEGIWIPKEYSGSYGTNGFYLKFVSGAVGTDSSGNGNNWTYSAGNASRNRPVQDSPTNNFNVMPFTNTALLTHEHQGMRVNTARTGHWDGVAGSFSVKSGKWYYEVQLNVGSSDNFRCVPGWKQEPEESEKVFNRLGSSGDPFGTGTGDLGNTGHYAYQSWNTQYYGNGGYTGTSIAASSGDVINVAVDFDNNKIYFGKNGTYIANDGGTDGDPANGTNESLSGLYSTGKYYSPSIALRSDGTAGSNSARFNFGSDRSFGANLALGTAYADENGYGEFRYAVPSGFLALCTQNFPEPEIIDSAEYFNTVLYTGNGGTSQSITGVGFQPDFLWTKSRTSSDNHHAFDSVRGASTARLFPNLTNAEDGNFGSINSFDSDGFTTGNNTGTNQNSTTYAAWNWKASGNTVTNNDGSLTSTVSVNTDAGFSIATFTNVATSGNQSFGHGLGATPTMVIVKRRTPADFWWVWHTGLSHAVDRYIKLNDTGAEITASGTWGGGITSSVVGLKGSSFSSSTSDTFVAYSFTNIEGYSKAGKYIGNFNADGPFIRTGFKPAWILLKRTDSADGWLMRDNKRDPDNVTAQMLIANETTAEYTDSTLIDFYSTGFKLKHQNSLMNASGGTFIYLAFAEQPFKYANAR